MHNFVNWIAEINQVQRFMSTNDVDKLYMDEFLNPKWQSWELTSQGQDGDREREKVRSL